MMLIVTDDKTQVMTDPLSNKGVFDIRRTVTACRQR
jgi:hypothetical protein